MSEIKIQIKNLYKIFGKNPKPALEQVKDGVNKDELLEKHNHVLGLKNINLEHFLFFIPIIWKFLETKKSKLKNGASTTDVRSNKKFFYTQSGVRF